MNTDVKEIKVVMLGDAGVGKSSIQLRFVNNDFSDNKESTLGAVFLGKNLIVDNKSYKFQIWDTAGQEKYHSLAPLYYKDAAVAIITYDITRRDSFDVLKNWVSELREHGPQHQVLALVGNKLDLIEQEQVMYEEALSYARDLGAIFKLTSAKVGQNISELFEEIARKIEEVEVEKQQNKKMKGSKLTTKGKEEKKKCC